MTYQCFDVHIEDAIAHITMKRPEKRNSMNAAFWNELPQIIADIDHNAKARVIVISSTGPHFTAGIDLAMFGHDDRAPDETPDTTQKLAGIRFYEHVQLLQHAFNAIEQARMPVLAAIQGGCIGGGVDLATACDLRYVTEDAFFSVEETNIAMTADVGTFPRLTKLIPEGLVKQMCFTGAALPAAEAYRWGLANQVFADHAQMLDGVMEIAANIATKAPLAVYGCKRMIHYARDHSTADTLDYVGIWNASMMQSDEVAEAIHARSEQRAGRFVDLPVSKTRIG
ncbi:MAG: crotonase/enoyl-CoA hydratase family protein [Pseudomonadota bacterium]